MSNIIVVRGSLGVGKTTISKMLAKDLDFEYISVDSILDEYKLDDGDDGIPLESFLKVNNVIEKLLQEKKNGFVIDGNFYYQKQIEDLQHRCKNDIDIVTLVSDVDTCMKRDAQREKVYGEDAARYVHMITSKVKAGYDVDNTDLSAEETVEAIKSYIK